MTPFLYQSISSEKITWVKVFPKACNEATNVLSSSVLVKHALRTIEYGPDTW